MVARKNMKFASDYERICERLHVTSCYSMVLRSQMFGD